MTTLSLCMIVRDNETTLPATLEGIRPWVDEIVVVDTGSNDATQTIAEQFGARLFHFPWCDDFSAARNESLRRARGEWLFWMDSDDTIDELNGQKLRLIADGSHNPRTLGYVMQVRCPGPDGEGETVVDHVKLIRNHPELRFEFRIHEQVLPAIRRLGGLVVWTDAFVVHSGADHSEFGRCRKYERDLRILNFDLAERGERPFVLWNLGMTYADMEDHETAVGFLRRCIAVSDPGESHLRKAYATLVGCLTRQGNPEQALTVCEAARHLFPNDRELMFRAGIVLHDLGRYEESIAAYRTTLSTIEERHFSSVDPGIYGHKARHNLAVVHRDADQLDLAETQWRLAIEDQPTFDSAWRGLIRLLITRRRLATAAYEVERMDALNIESTRLMRAEVAEGEGDMTRAAKEFNRSMAESPSDNDAHESWCRFLFLNGDWCDAVDALKELTKRRPEDGATLHNLGVLHLRVNALDDAVAYFRGSLAARPGWVPTLLALGEAHRGLGDVVVARRCFDEVLNIEPENPDATAQLRLLSRFDG